MIHIACSADDYYVPHCAAMLHSLLSVDRSARYCVHFLHSELSSDNLAGLQALVESNHAELQLHFIGDDAMRGFPTDKFHKSCWYRILLPNLLPTVSRVLYLDADMIIMDPVEEVWAMPLDGKLFAAVVNPLYPFMPNRIKEQLHLGDSLDYLNSGVLLMDLDRMRAANVVERVRSYAEAHPENIWPEQDALSVVCQGEWKALSPRWNAQSTLFDLRAKQLPFRRTEIEEARRRPAIVHFIGPLKPWSYLCRHPFRHYYHRHRRQTLWSEYQLEGRSLTNLLLRPMSLQQQIQARRLINYFRLRIGRIF